MRALLAYVPVLNQRHVDWFKRHEESPLYLIPQEMAVGFLPRLSRNIAAVSPETTATSIRFNGLIREVAIFNPENWDPRLAKDSGWKDWVLPDEDISHEVAERYLKPIGASCLFEEIWARWDMTAVQKMQPVIPDVIVSESEFDQVRMRLAECRKTDSPDWWRQIGAVLFDAGGEPISSACNLHMPNEYETYIFGDPRLNVDAGQIGKYTSLHAEKAVIVLAARLGRPTNGGSMYVTVFPCEDCAREIAFAGISKVFFREGYSALNAREVFRSWGVEVVQVKGPESA